MSSGPPLRSRSRTATMAASAGTPHPRRCRPRKVVVDSPRVAVRVSDVGAARVPCHLSSTPVVPRVLHAVPATAGTAPATSVVAHAPAATAIVNPRTARPRVAECGSLVKGRDRTGPDDAASDTRHRAATLRYSSRQAPQRPRPASRAARSASRKAAACVNGFRRTTYTRA